MKKRVWSLTTKDLDILLKGEESKVELLDKMFKGDTTKYSCEYYFGFDEYNMINKYTLSIFIDDGCSI